MSSYNISLFLLALLLCSSHIAEGSIRGGNDRSLQTVGTVDRLILINAATDLPIVDLANDMVVNIATVNANSFAIEATTVGGSVGSVQFGYNGNPSFKIEQTARYAMCNNSGDDFAACSVLVVGQHNLTVTTYSGTRARGTIGSIKNLSFRIVNIPLTKVPTKAPVTNVPTKAPTMVPVATVSCNIPKMNSTRERFTPDFPNATEEAQSERIGNDLISTGGFFNRFKNVTTATFARDISSPNMPWRRMDDMPVAVGITHGATVVIGMKMYMCGGYSGPPPGPHVADCLIYDHSKAPGTGQWSTFTSLPNGGTAGGGMIYDNARNALYYVGGAQRPSPGSRFAIDLNNTWKFSFDNPGAGWVATAPIPYVANHQSFVTVDFQGEERHFFAGGQEGENESKGNVADVFEFKAATETWIRRSTMPYGRGHAATSTRAYGCGFFMAGGAINSVTTGNQLNRTSDIHYYHIPSDNWTLIGNLPAKGATQKVYMDEENNYMYYVASSGTARYKFSL